MRTLISVLACVALCACSTDTTGLGGSTGPQGNTDPSADLVGTWHADSAPLMTAATFTIRRGTVTPYTGEVTATLADCGDGRPCQIDGGIFNGAKSGADATIDFTFFSRPIGGEIIGTFYADGVFRGKLVLRTNGAEHGPETITLHH